MHRAAPAIVALLLTLTSVTAAPVAAASPAPGGASPQIEADVDGTPIATASIPSYHCHDRAFPKIHCFTSASARDRSLASSADLLSAPGVQAASASDFVVVFASTSYFGSSMYISQDYDTLALVGWNDRIRSFKGLNNGQGIFWTDWYATGSPLAFCCNVNDPSLPATFDQQITSVYRR